MEDVNRLEAILAAPGVGFYTVGLGTDHRTTWPVELIEMPKNVSDVVDYMKRIARNRYELYRNAHPSLELLVSANGHAPLRVCSFPDH